MNEDNLLRYHELLHQGQQNAAQQLTKKGFSSYLFQLSGSKFLLHKLIQLPILAQCSAEQPAKLHAVAPSLMKCMTDLQEYKKTDEYKAAVARSKSVPATAAA